MCAAPPAPGPPAELAHFYEQDLAWVQCAGFPVGAGLADTDGEGGFVCARLSVPLDYAASEGETAQIAVIKLPGGPGASSLVVNPGGPGGSGGSGRS